METHAHHLHKAPGKKFWHFFFEFFMLFLAVFCGLLAENWREHFVENKREKEYMQTMLEDLHSDTAEIQRQITLGMTMVTIADSLIDILNHEDVIANTQMIYRLGFFRIVKAQLEDRTSSQLKNAGGMRLIRNTKVAEELREYWNVNKGLENMTDRMEERANASQLIGSQIFSNKYLIVRNKENPLEGFDVDPAARIVNNDQHLLSQYSNLRFQHTMILRNYVRNLKFAKSAATELIQTIQKEYDLK